MNERRTQEIILTSLPQPEPLRDGQIFLVLGLQELLVLFGAQEVHHRLASLQFLDDGTIVERLLQPVREGLGNSWGKVRRSVQATVRLPVVRRETELLAGGDVGQVRAPLARADGEDADLPRLQ